MGWDNWNFIQLKKNPVNTEVIGYRPPAVAAEGPSSPLRLLLVDDECGKFEDELLNFCQINLGIHGGECPADIQVEVFFTDDFNLADVVMADPEKFNFDGIVQDLMLGHDRQGSGALEGLKNLETLRGTVSVPRPGVIVVTQHSDRKTREATKAGLPFHFAIAKQGSRKDVQRSMAAQEISDFFNYVKFRRLIRISPFAAEFSRFVGVSTVKQVVDFLDFLDRDKSDKKLPVVILGATGTGKELIARLIHASDCVSRGEQVSFDHFMPILTGAIGEGVQEGELFGIEELQNSPKIDGYLRGARMGTAFFDELGDIALSIQGKLLRFLQEKKVRPIGGDWVEVDGVRSVFATHADVETLFHQAEAGVFREDFLQRIDGLTIRLPDLSERMDEHQMLIDYFFASAGVQQAAGKSISQAISNELNERLLQMCADGSFTGNVRQLERFIRRLVLVAPRGKSVGMDAFELAMRYSLLHPGVKPDTTDPALESDAVHPLESIFGEMGWNSFFTHPDRWQKGRLMNDALQRGFKTTPIVAWLIDKQLEQSGNGDFLDSKGNVIEIPDEQDRLGKLSSLYNRSRDNWIEYANSRG